MAIKCSVVVHVLLIENFILNNLHCYTPIDRYFYNLNESCLMNITVYEILLLNQLSSDNKCRSGNINIPIQFIAQKQKYSLDDLYSLKIKHWNNDRFYRITFQCQ